MSGLVGDGVRLACFVVSVQKSVDLISIFSYFIPRCNAKVNFSFWRNVRFFYMFFTFYQNKWFIIPFMEEDFVMIKLYSLPEELGRFRLNMVGDVGEKTITSLTHPHKLLKRKFL